MACLGWAAPELAATHSAPWSDSFESYSSGMLLQGANGWSSNKIGAGLVTNAVSQVFALTNPYGMAHEYPLSSASHTNVVAVTDLLGNDILSSSGKVAVLDFTGVTEVDSAAVALALECLREARRRKLALSLANLPEAMLHLAQLYAVSELLQPEAG